MNVIQVDESLKKVPSFAVTFQKFYASLLTIGNSNEDVPLIVLKLRLHSGDEIDSWVNSSFSLVEARAFFLGKCQLFERGGNRDYNYVFLQRVKKALQ